MMTHPNTVMTLSDSGAHIGQIADASIQTYLLADRVRERKEITLPRAVRMLSADMARVWGFDDRGTVAEGNVADLNIFDPESVGPDMPFIKHDLPAGAMRFHQTASGFLATLVAGQAVSLEGGEHTGSLGGRLLRRQPRRLGRRS